MDKLQLVIVFYTRKLASKFTSIKIFMLSEPTGMHEGLNQPGAWGRRPQ